VDVLLVHCGLLVRPAYSNSLFHQPIPPAYSAFVDRLVRNWRSLINFIIYGSTSEEEREVIRVKVK